MNPDPTTVLVEIDTALFFAASKGEVEIEKGQLVARVLGAGRSVHSRPNVMPDRPDLYLMRHGETLWNREGRLQGHFDAALTARGIRQAGWQAQLIAGLDGHRVSSPQHRAVASARIAFGDATFATDGRLAEIGIGQFAGRLTSQLAQELPHLAFGADLAWYDHCPGGEGLQALARRCESFLGDLKGPTLVMTHGITLRMLRLLAMGETQDRLACGTMRQGVVYAIRHGRCKEWRHSEDQD